MATEQRSGGQGSTTEAAKQKAKQVGDTVQHKAEDMEARAEDMAREQVDERSDQLADRVHEGSDSLHRLSSTLRDEGQKAAAGWVDEAAARVDGFGDYLERASADEMMRDAQGFARRNAWALAAGALVLGVAAARFVRASTDQPSQNRGEHHPMVGDYAYREPGDGQRERQYGYGGSYPSAGRGAGYPAGSEERTDYGRPYGEPYGGGYSERTAGYEGGPETEPPDLDEDDGRYRRTV